MASEGATRRDLPRDTAASTLAPIARRYLHTGRTFCSLQHIQLLHSTFTKTFQCKYCQVSVELYT